MTTLPPDDDDTPTPEVQGLPRPTILISAVAIAASVAMTFVILKWSDSRAAAAELRAQNEAVEADLAEIRPQLEGVEGELGGLERRTGLLDRGKLVVCNFSGDPVTVKHLAVTWLDPDGTFRTYNSADKGLDRWRVPAGERLAIDDPAAGWDGTATYYSLWLRVRGEEYPFAGTWPLADDCVLWT